MVTKEKNLVKIEKNNKEEKRIQEKVDFFKIILYNGFSL